MAMASSGRRDERCTFACEGEGASTAWFEPPPSGDVVQWINPMSWFLSGNPVNAPLGGSSAPAVEAEVLDRIGTCGEQIGQTTDALAMPLRHLPDRASLSPDERDAVAKLEAIAAEVAAIKRKHRRGAPQPRSRRRGLPRLGPGRGGLALSGVLHGTNRKSERPPRSVR